VVPGTTTPSLATALELETELELELATVQVTLPLQPLPLLLLHLLRPLRPLPLLRLHLLLLLQPRVRRPVTVERAVGAGKVRRVDEGAKTAALRVMRDDGDVGRPRDN